MKIPANLKLNVKIMSPLETFFEGQVSSLSAVSTAGPFDVLPGHANFMALLVKGDIVLATAEGERSIAINHGIIHVSSDKVELLTTV